MSSPMTTRHRSGGFYDPMSLARTLFGFDPFGRMPARASKSGFVPAFEAKETESAYIISGDLPGIAKDDLDISMHDNILTISGTRNSTRKQEEETYFLYERQYGSFSRSFSLPEAADSDTVEATLDNGVLTLTIGKKAESRPRKIEIAR